MLPTLATLALLTLSPSDWPDEQTEGVNGGDGSAQHLWEESWDDDDTNEDFAVMLKEELKRVGGGK